MEIENYEESLRGLICTGKEDSSRCPFLKHQLCKRETGALFIVTGVSKCHKQGGYRNTRIICGLS